MRNSQATPPDRKHRRLAPSVAIAVSMLAVVLAGLLLIPSVAELRQLLQPGDGAQWSIFQAQNEFNRFHIALNEYNADDPSAPGTVRTRFDILYSRIDLLRTAATYDDLREAPEVKPRLRALTTFATTADSYLQIDDARLAQNIPALRDLTTQNQRVVQALVLASMRYFVERSVERRSRLSQLLLAIAGAGFVVTVALAGSLLVTAGRNRSLRRQADELSEVAVALADAERIGGHGGFARDLRSGKGFYSAEFRRLVGLAADAPADRKLAMERVHPDDRQRVGEAVETLTRIGHAGDTVEMVFRVGDEVTGWRWLECTTELQGGDGALATGIAGTLRDISRERTARAGLTDQKMLAEAETRIARSSLAASLTDIRAGMDRVAAALAAADPDRPALDATDRLEAATAEVLRLQQMIGPATAGTARVPSPAINGTAHGHDAEGRDGGTAAPPLP